MELKGSRTEKNLEAAFAGESQARNKYSFFATAAKEAGFAEVAEVFQDASENERAHAKRELEFLKGIADTVANLKAAAAGEHYEWTKMYPEFERVAREEGFIEIATFFKRVAAIEEQHEKRYLALLDKVGEKKAAKKGKMTLWQCRNCGWFQKDLEAPNECPTCSAPQSGFGILDEFPY